MEEKIRALKENMNTYENWGDTKYKGLLEHVLKHYPDVSEKQLKTIEINYSYLQKWLKDPTKSATKKINIDVNKIKSEIKKYFKFFSLTDKEIDELIDYLKEHLEKKVVYYWNTSDFDGIMISVGPNEDCWDTLTEYMDKNLVKLLNKCPAFIKDDECYHVKTFENNLYTTKDLKEFEDYLKKNGWTAIRVGENEDSDDLDELHNGFYEQNFLYNEEAEDRYEEIEISDSIKFLNALIKKFKFNFFVGDICGWDMLGNDYRQNEFEKEKDLTKDEIKKIREFNDEYRTKSEEEIISMFKNVQFAKINISADNIIPDEIDNDILNKYLRIVKILSSYEFSLGNGIWTGYLMLVENNDNDRFIAGAIIDKDKPEEGNFYLGLADDVDKKDFDNNILWLIQNYLYYGIGREKEY